MESIDDLLAQVKAEYGDRAKEQAQTFKQQRQESSPSTPAPPASPSRPSSARVDGLLAELGGEYQERDRLEAQKKQQRVEIARRQQEQQRQQQRQALHREAETWLKNLDRYSGEGLWFTEFAQGYSSPLEAAIDYLEALKEVQP